MKVSLQPHTMLLPSPVLIIGSYDAEGKANIMNAAWGGIASSQPPCISVSLREATLTYHNISASGAFTVNYPSVKHVTEADFVGTVSGRNFDKFRAAKLTPVKSDKVNAPYVAEFPLALECKLVQKVPLGLHTMFIGEIVGMVGDEEILGENGMPDIEKVKPFVWGASGAMAYYSLGDPVGKAFSTGKELNAQP
jgi:flavin reductase (DIM6/NTAB) family NADH-FMN oxidoreductase RutF